MAVVAPAEAPTRVDAERAAQTLIAAGVEEVLLFGSVARGTAGPHSDIDLVAIFADLDYADRAERARHLEAAAGEVVPWPVQVHATDRPEWRNRVELAATSFEHRIAQDAFPVAAAAAESPVDWGKEMVLPMTNPQEALRYFKAWVLTRLREVALNATRDDDESHPHLSPARQERARLQRLAALCTAAALTAETSLKVLAVLYGEHPPTEQETRNAGHSIAKCLQLLPPAVHPEAAAVFSRLGVDLEPMSAWRVGGTYPLTVATTDDSTDEPDGTITATIDTGAGYTVSATDAAAERLAPTYAVMASEITALLAAHLQQALPLNPALDDALAERDRRAALITSVDVRAGTPTLPDGINP